MMKRLSIAIQQQTASGDSTKRSSLTQQQQTTGSGNMKRMSMAQQAGGGSTITAPSEMGESTLSESTARGARPSLSNAMFARRFAKRMSTRFMDRRTLGIIGGSSAGFLEKEPTYRMEPAKMFSPSEAEKVIKEVLEERLGECKYNPKYCSNMTKNIADEIKDKVKYLGYDRYKIVCSVVICQRSEQAAVCSSRCIMDKKNDTFATYTLKSPTMVCNATVYAIYHE